MAKHTPNELDAQAVHVKALSRELCTRSAEYIVRACESHEDLVDLLVLSLGALVAIFVPATTKIGDKFKIAEPYAGLMNKLEAAIKKAQP